MKNHAKSYLFEEKICLFDCLLLQINGLYLQRNLKNRKYNAMRYERYNPEVSSDILTFEFTSVGPKGEIPKVVIYSKLPIKNLYNLGFGDRNIETGAINDLIVTDNKDSKKVLATVAFTAYAFINKYPKALIILRGSTKVRTRLYQMGISNNLEEISIDFNVYGRKDRMWYAFEKNVEYDTFLITHKKNRRWKI